MNDEDEIEDYWRDVSPPAVAPSEPLTPPARLDSLEHVCGCDVCRQGLSGQENRVVTIGEPIFIPPPPPAPSRTLVPQNVRLARAMHALWIVSNIWIYGGLTSWHDGEWHWAWHPQWAAGQALAYVTGLIASVAVNSVES